MEPIHEQTLVRKMFLRIVPLLMLIYFISYIDRINVGFAALTMNKEIGLTAYLFGWGAGIFFIGYFLFEIPSNLFMERLGARRWFARILFTWGLLSCAMAFAQGPKSFLVLRFFLGVSEAGFFPGVILYLTYWFPARYRARIVAAFTLSVPISVAIGAPLSVWILGFDGVGGLRGWQWLFIVEGLPAVLATCLVLRCLADRPANVSWLSAEEKNWVHQQLALDEQRSTGNTKVNGVWEAFRSPAVIGLAFVYFCNTGANLGLSFFMPQIVKLHGYSMPYIGLITSIPYVTGCAGMLLCGYVSDRFHAPRAMLVTTVLMAAGGFSLAAALPPSNWSIVALSIAAVGILGSKGPFWALPPLHLSRKGAAGGIAFINAIGNLGGFAGPFALGYLKSTSSDFSSGLYLLATVVATSALAVLVMIKARTPPTRPTAALANTEQRHG
jgi:ACS family tartrate transporter-like MFS transporter